MGLWCDLCLLHSLLVVVKYWLVVAVQSGYVNLFKLYLKGLCREVVVYSFGDSCIAIVVM